MAIEIPYIAYNNPIDYERNLLSSTASIVIPSINVLKYFAYQNGVYSGGSLTSEGKEFYFSLVKMALEEQTCIIGRHRFHIGKDYENAEPSIKVSMSFLLGMIMTRLVADQIFGIRWLYHLKDHGALNVRPNSNMSPDMFGVKKGGTAYLFEAKGTAGESVDYNRINHAKGSGGQLDSVLSVDVTGWRNHLHTKFEKHAVATAFPAGELTISDIDPPEESGRVRSYTIDVNKTLHSYYKNLLDSSEKREDKHAVSIGNHVFEPYSLGSLNIGIDTQISDSVKAIESDNIQGNDFFDNLSERLFGEDGFEDYRQESLQKNAYLMRDGVLVFNE